MFISANLFVLLCIVLQCKCELQIIKNELSEEVKILAIGTVERQLLLKHNDSVVAQTISNDFSKIYGEKWTCFVGPSDFIDRLIPQINAAPNTTLWFAYNTTHVLLFKSNQCEATAQSTYKDVIDATLDYNITYRYTNFNNSSIVDAILMIIKDSIAAEAGINCTTVPKDNWVNKDDCYYNLAIHINSKLYAKYADNHWLTIVGKVNSAAISDLYYKNAFQVVFNHILDIIVFSN